MLHLKSFLIFRHCVVNREQGDKHEIIYRAHNELQYVMKDWQL